MSEETKNKLKEIIFEEPYYEKADEIIEDYVEQQYLENRLYSLEQNLYALHRDKNVKKVLGEDANLNLKPNVQEVMAEIEALKVEEERNISSHSSSESSELGAELAEDNEIIDKYENDPNIPLVEAELVSDEEKYNDSEIIDVYRGNPKNIEDSIVEETEISKIEKEILEIQKGLSDNKIEKTIVSEKDNTNYDQRLTEEQIEELKANLIEPGDQEYRMALINYGINPDVNVNNKMVPIKNDQRLKYLLDMKKAYYDLQSGIIEDLNMISKKTNYTLTSEEEVDYLINRIEELEKHQENINKLKTWNKYNKLEKELRDQIKKKILKAKEKPMEPEDKPMEPEDKPVKTDKPVKKGKDGKLWGKALAGATGFVAGVGLSAVAGSVPIVGTGLAIYAGTRLVYNAGKMACNIVTKINKGKEPKIITAIKDKIPEPMKKAAHKLFDKPKNPYARWFVNGVSLGYMADRMFDLHEKFQGTNKPMPKAHTVEATQPQAQNPVVDPQPTVDTNGIQVGDKVDLSQISRGHVASATNDSVHLITSAGKDATLQRVITGADGEKWFHFLQPSGQGYAWFSEDELLKAGIDVAKAVGKSR